MLGLGWGFARAQTPDQPPDLILTEQDNGTTVAAFVGQGISVVLPGNPTTGYSWLLTTIKGTSVETNGPAIYTSSGGPPGSGGTFSFPFLAGQPGSATLALEYRQPWDPQSTAGTFGVTIQVAAAVERPRLAITLSTTNIVITWPMAGSSGFFLEGTSSLSQPNWAALNVLPLPEGTNYSATLGHDGPSLFFRLRQ